MQFSFNNLEGVLVRGRVVEYSLTLTVVTRTNFLPDNSRDLKICWNFNLKHKENKLYVSHLERCFILFSFSCDWVRIDLQSQTMALTFEVLVIGIGLETSAIAAVVADKGWNFYPAWNSAHLLFETLFSVLEQTQPLHIYYSYSITELWALVHLLSVMGESLRLHACYEDYLDTHLVDEDLYYLKVRSAHCMVWFSSPKV